LHCHLLIPDLFLPYSPKLDYYQGLALPALEKLLGRSQWRHSHGDSLETWLCRAFGVAQQQDWPIAPITLSGDGGDPGPHYWLRADPVHLRVQRDQIILADSATFQVSQQEAEQLVDALNRHFAQDNMTFYALRPDRWYLRLEQAPNLVTTMLADVAGKSIDPRLPAGTDGMRWHTLFNEIQMLFHDHPVNESREAGGQMPINSVWIWGGGTATACVKPAYTKVWAQDVTARSMALVAGADHADLPTSAGQWLAASRGEGSHLIVLDLLRGAAQYGDAYGWREGMLALERDWFGPLLDALGKRKISRLTIHVPDPHDTQVFELDARGLWKFWHRSKSAHSYAPHMALP
jgi:hypothetical protein